MNSKFKIFTFVLMFFVLSNIVSAQPRPKFSKNKIRVGKKIITIEVADTPDETAYGLMFKKTLGEDEGMLFIFPYEQSLSFWMKNTFVDLSIAYIDSNKKITEILEMKAAQSELQSHFENYASSKPVLYALEMNKEWFTKNKIKVGSTIIILK